MNPYEITFIIRPDLEDEQTGGAIDQVNGRLEASGAEIIATYPWSPARRRMAFPIRDFGDGVYVTTTFQIDPQAIRELENGLKLNTSVLRFLVVQATELNIKQSQQRMQQATAPPPAPAPAAPPPAPAAEMPPVAPVPGQAESAPSMEPPPETAIPDVDVPLADPTVVVIEPASAEPVIALVEPDMVEPAVDAVEPDAAETEVAPPEPGVAEPTAVETESVTQVPEEAPEPGISTPEARIPVAEGEE